MVGILGLDIYAVGLFHPGLMDESPSSIFITLPLRCIVLLEDIDAVKRGAARISVSGLLNIIDGTYSYEGHILIMTTNCCPESSLHRLRHFAAPPSGAAEEQLDCFIASAEAADVDIGENVLRGAKQHVGKLEMSVNNQPFNTSRQMRINSDFSRTEATSTSINPCTYASPTNVYFSTSVDFSGNQPA